MKLPVIPAGTFLHGTTTIVALTGCLPAAADPNTNDPPTAAKCGSDYAAATGNLSIKLYKSLDRTVADPAKMGVQVLQASSAFEGQVAKPLMGTLVTGFASTDGGPLGPPVTVGQAFASLQPDAAAPQTGVLTDPANTVVYGALVQADGGPVVGPNGPINVALPLTAVTRLSIGSLKLPDGGAYLTNGANFTFVLIGDPAKPTFLDDAGTKFNPQSMHWIALPNDPTLPPLN